MNNLMLGDYLKLSPLIGQATSGNYTIITWWRMAAPFVRVSDKKKSSFKENTIPNSAEYATKFGVQLFYGSISVAELKWTSSRDRFFK